MGAVTGTRVVELTCGTAEMLAGMMLCDQGATVVQVEPPGGSRARVDPEYFVWNRGKERIVLDVQEAASRATLQPILAHTDVLLHHFLPDVARRLGVDHATLSATQPRLVTCSITGHGTQGPLVGLVANDALIAARFGLTSNQPGWSPGPSHIVHPLPSIGAALLAVQGVCAALLARKGTGRGQHVETSLMAGTFAMSTRVTGEKIPKDRAWSWRASGPAPFYGAYECADGAWLQLGCIHVAFVERAIEALGIQDLTSDPRFGDRFFALSNEAQDALFDIVARALRTKPRAAWISILGNADVPVAPIQTASEFFADPQVRANGLIHLDDPEVGSMEQIGVPVRLSATPGRAGKSSLAPGQHRHCGWSTPGMADPAIGRARISDEPRLTDAAWTSRHQRSLLAGIHVLEFANLIAGPMAGRFLADLGAEVVKVEAPDGGDIARRNGSPAFLPLNSGKRGTAINLRLEEGRAIGQELSRRADVVIDNMRPGVAERLGLGWSQLQALNPRLVYCQVTAFGSHGPYAHKAGLDPLAGALAGVQMAQGGYAGKPVYLQGAAVDHTAALLACNGILLALLARQRSGRGQHVETSLLDAAALINSQALARCAGQTPSPEVSRSQYGPHALYRLYQTADYWLYLAVGTDQQWQSLCQTISQQELLTDRRFGSVAARSHNDEALAALLAAVFKRQGTDRWLPVLQAAGIPCALSTEEYDHRFQVDDAAIANGLIFDQDHPAFGAIALGYQWLRFSAAALAPPTPAPLLGQHTAQVLVGLGYTEDTIDALQRRGVIHVGGDS